MNFHIAISTLLEAAGIIVAYSIGKGVGRASAPVRHAPMFFRVSVNGTSAGGFGITDLETVREHGLGFHVPQADEIDPDHLLPVYDAHGNCRQCGAHYTSGKHASACPFTEGSARGE